MSKEKSLTLSLIITLLISTVAVNANTNTTTTTVQQIQSPIYTDDIGRSHFLGRGGYSTVRHTQMQQEQSNFINDAVNEYSKIKKNAEKDAEEIKKIRQEAYADLNKEVTDITTVIKEKQEVPVSNKSKATFSAEQPKMDASASFGRGATNIESSGVNNSKTMYKDDIGRLHFFGKGNIVKE